MGGTDLAAFARAVLDANRYVVCGTADAGGTPWVAPVFYTLNGYSELVWISSPDARHSRNIAVRPEVSLVVFDSRVPVGGATAVYMAGVAVEVAGADVAPCAAAYNERSLAKGGQEIGVHEVREGGQFRLYRATVAAHWALDPDRRPAGRLPVAPG
jgi:hypothetical protein